MRTAGLTIRLVVWTGIVLFIAWVWRKTGPVPGPDWTRLGITLIKDKLYRTDGPWRLTLDLYVRANASRGREPPRLRPVVIAIHGGSWYGGTKVIYRNDPRNTVIRLASQGIVVVAIDYRLARPGAPTWPAVVEDVREAVRWVRRQAASLEVDPDRIVLMGQSAGAHLAMLAATTPDDPDGGVSARVQGVVSFYGPTDLRQLINFRHLPHEPLKTFLGADGTELLRLADDASPIHHIESGDPPMLFLHGTDDLWVPPEQSLIMAEALKRAGVRNRVIIVDGARHGFETLFEQPQSRDLLPEILAFLESVWNVSLTARRSASVESTEITIDPRVE
jgi:acetyl esterase/lipase